MRFEKVNVRSTMFYGNYDGSFRSGCYAYKFQMTSYQVDYYGDTVFKDGNLFLVCGGEK